MSRFAKRSPTSMFRPPNLFAAPQLGRAVRIRITLAALAAAASWVPLCMAQAGAANEGRVVHHEAGVDAGIKPGDDFFGYANGDWLKATALPPGAQRWSARHDIAELTRGQLLKLLDDAASAPSGSLARKVADFRAAWLNEAAIEAKGLAPVSSLLNEIDAVRNKAELTRLLGRRIRADVDPMNGGVFRSAHLLGLAVQASIHGDENNVAFLVQGGLGLQRREDYLGAEPASQAMRSRYQQAMTHLLTLAGQGTKASIASRAEAVMALELAIAKTHASPEDSDRERNADNRWNRADFAREAPGLDWSAFLSAAGLANEKVIVAWQPGAVKGAAALVASQPLDVWKDYLRVRVLAEYADVLPRSVGNHRAALHGLAESGATPSRAQRATEATETAMSEAIGRLYVDRHFPPAYKARVQAIVANVKAALARRVDAAAWLSPDSKVVAQAKLKAIYFGVGYPDKWGDLSGLVIDASDAVGNSRRLAERRYRQTIARLGKRVDPTDWAVTPHWVGAVLLFQQNAYNFSAGLLQVPKFDPDATDAMNYGAIGAIVGHEMIHFIDALGGEYGVDGRLQRWWKPEDLTRYESAYQPLVNQFSAYRPFADLAVDGKRTLTENIADLGGLGAAFDAYRATLGERSADKEYLLQQDRQFFIGFARSWRGKLSESGLRSQLAGRIHAPESYRIATVRNMDAWYEAFDVRPGQRLHLEPGARVRIW